MRHENEARKLRESEAAARKQLQDLQVKLDWNQADGDVGTSDTLQSSPNRHERRKIRGNVAIRGGERRRGGENGLLVGGDVQQVAGGNRPLTQGKATSNMAYTPKARSPSKSSPSLGSSGKKKSLFGRLSFF